MGTVWSEETPPSGHDALLFYDKIQRIFYMHTRMDIVKHNKAFDYVVIKHGSEWKQRRSRRDLNPGDQAQSPIIFYT